MIPMIDEITIRTTFGDPDDPCAPLCLDSDTDGPVVDEEGVVGGCGSGGQSREEGEGDGACEQG